MINTYATLPKKVYHLSWLAYGGWLLLALVLCVASIEGSLSLAQSLQDYSTTTDIIAALLFIGTFLFAIYLLWSAHRICLVLTNDGLTFYGLRYRIYTPWQNVIGIEKMHIAILGIIGSSFTGLRLYNDYRYDIDIEEGRRLGIAVMEVDWPESMRSMQVLHHVFPIMTFIAGYDWPGKALGKDMQRYAPWLFAQQFHQ